MEQESENEMTIILKPCPFCGGDIRLDGFYFLMCDLCSLRMYDYNNELLIEKWNRRVKTK